MILKSLVTEKAMTNKLYHYLSTRYSSPLERLTACAEKV